MHRSFTVRLLFVFSGIFGFLSARTSVQPTQDEYLAYSEMENLNHDES